MFDEPLFGPDYSDFNLTSTKRRNVVLNVLPGFIEKGWNKTKALAHAQKWGYGIQQSTFSQMYDEVLGIEKKASTVRYTGKEKQVTRKSFAPYYTPIDTDYYLVTRYKYYDAETGETKIGEYGAKVNELGTRQEIEARFKVWIEEGDSPPHGEVYEVSLIKGFYGID